LTLLEVLTAVVSTDRHHNIEMYAAYPNETKCKLVLDSGATKLCGSLVAPQEFQRLMKSLTGSNDTEDYDMSQTTTFRFGHGKTLKLLGLV
jgi:hypothetical protein